MSGADWDSFFAGNPPETLEIDLNSVNRQQVEDLFVGVSVEELNSVAAALNIDAASEAEKRRKIATVLKTIGRIGDIGLKIFKVVV